MTASADSPRGQLPRWIPMLAALLATGYLLWLLRTVLTPVLGGFLIAYMLDPVVDRLERWRIPRAAGIALVLAGALAALGLVLLLVLPGVVREFGQFAQELPKHAASLMRKLEPWLAERGIQTPHSVQDVIDQLGVDVRSLAGKLAAPAGQILSYVAGGTASVLGSLAGLLLIPVFAFYLLYDFDRITSGARELVPVRIRPDVLEIAGEIDAALAQFVRGQLLIMVILAVLYAVAYSLLGVRLAVPIGIVAGLLSFIPYVGGATALGLALLMCALGGSSWAQVGGVVGAYAVIQALEGFVITPRIMEEKVGLTAVWVLLALMVFGELFGFFGVLLAVPAAAVSKIFVVRAVAQYRTSRLFLGETDEEAKGTRASADSTGAPSSAGTPSAKNEPARRRRASAAELDAEGRRERAARSKRDARIGARAAARGPEEAVVQADDRAEQAESHPTAVPEATRDTAPPQPAPRTRSGAPAGATERAADASAKPASAPSGNAQTPAEASRDQHEGRTAKRSPPPSDERARGGTATGGGGETGQRRRARKRRRTTGQGR